MYGEISRPNPLVVTTSSYEMAGIAGAELSVRTEVTSYPWVDSTYKTSGEFPL